MNRNSKTILLIHGLWDDPKIFRKLKQALLDLGYEVHAPHLPHSYGAVSIESLSDLLNNYIQCKINDNSEFDLVGFSMGGLIAQYWIKNFDTTNKTRRFISIGTPHRGTFVAQFIPSWLLKGISQMKRNSKFINKLNKDYSYLKGIDCTSFYCPYDLMVIPSWGSVLPIGRIKPINVITHKQLISNQNAIKKIINEFKLTKNLL